MRKHAHSEADGDRIPPHSGVGRADTWGDL